MYGISSKLFKNHDKFVIKNSKIIYLCFQISSLIFLFFPQFTPTVDENLYKLTQLEYLFSNEIAAYEYILPTFSQNLTVFQYFYSYNIPKTKACIVLEDFGPLGFRMSKELVNLPLDHIILAGNNNYIIFKSSNQSL